MAPNKASKPQTEQPAAVSNVGEEEENLDLHTNLDMNEKVNPTASDTSKLLLTFLFRSTPGKTQSASNSPKGSTKKWKDTTEESPLSLILLRRNSTFAATGSSLLTPSLHRADYRINRSDLHHDQQRRLYKLAQRRSEIEEQIVQHAQILDKACISASRELEAAAKGRLQDLEQGQDEEEQEEQAEGTEEADTEHRDSQEC